MKQDLRPYDLQGLCMTCDHAPTCGYLARTEGPIWRCEEFDDSGAFQTRPAFTMDSVPDRTAAAPTRSDDEAPLGLCVNCENRSSCRLPGAREGAWFCEEYR